MPKDKTEKALIRSQGRLQPSVSRLKAFEAADYEDKMNIWWSELDLEEKQDWYIIMWTWGTSGVTRLDSGRSSSRSNTVVTPKCKESMSTTAWRQWKPSGEWLEVLQTSYYSHKRYFYSNNEEITLTPWTRQKCHISPQNQQKKLRNYV